MPFSLFRLVFDAPSKHDGSKSLDIYLKNDRLNEVSDHPYLGLQLDRTLKWNYHIMKIWTNVSETLSLMNRIRQFFKKNVLNDLYKSII